VLKGRRGKLRESRLENPLASPLERPASKIPNTSPKAKRSAVLVLALEPAVRTNPLARNVGAMRQRLLGRLIKGLVLGVRKYLKASLCAFRLLRLKGLF
jgi:hypothetical protein